jgi:hypothetical protein
MNNFFHVYTVGIPNQDKDTPYMCSKESPGLSPGPGFCKLEARPIGRAQTGLAGLGSGLSPSPVHHYSRTSSVSAFDL